ncbi:Predicted ATPase of the ABC class [Acetitomaculum ruminis DSM 5522]|uniref:Predicted ATPase of the ABC class n=1 Tax=Acetitomaculum ruminis DSM 5522 TaxID=1120918 RepID=A0A1I0Y0Y2_9FIRM|nr:ABC-ATPase domain-containing protein [Acetitomaculum ruminis]SFB06537.1 Predicted ATPase of the ABC class [Acetitomaculum ruminis DSM 5522]
MKSSDELKNALLKMDKKSYKLYKSLEGMWNFRDFILCIDHVQADPFATPSRVRLIIDNKNNFPDSYFENKVRKIALEDFLLRRLHKFLKENSTSRRGSGKSGLVGACPVKQEVLERIAVIINKKQIEARLEVGFPAFGRSIAAKEFEPVLFNLFPKLEKEVFLYENTPKDKLEESIFLADDQNYIREELEKRNLLAFVADGSILPRESGVSNKPMKNAIPFKSPKSLEVTLNLPHMGQLTGMGIKPGITTIAGGGYHGKSTLLKALESGIYNHIKGDGREYVITRKNAVKLRAEEGRPVNKVDISMFINNLPFDTDTSNFSTQNASGSTSQAANTVEAAACGSDLFLIDEDTSATNFMVRDSIMASLVPKENEPITPFLSCMRSLYEDLGISSILVIGSCGSYLPLSDTVIQMDNYKAIDLTKKAMEISKEINNLIENKKVSLGNIFKNSVTRKHIEKAKVHDIHTLSLDKNDIDLRSIEQICDSGQTAALAYIMQYALSKVADGKKNPLQIAKEVMEIIENKGFSAVVPKNYPAGSPVMVRLIEIVECLSRYRAN